MDLGLFNKIDLHLHLSFENPTSKANFIYIALWHINKS